jgi:hypothetical protein
MMWSDSVAHAAMTTGASPTKLWLHAAVASRFEHPVELVLLDRFIGVTSDAPSCLDSVVHVHIRPPLSSFRRF